MSGERLLASYLLRVAFRDGRRVLRLHVVHSGVTHRFATYRDLAEALARLEGDATSDLTALTAEEGTGTSSDREDPAGAHAGKGTT